MDIQRDDRNSCRLVFVLYPFQGHINPMLQLATILHSKGFSITIVHPQFNSPNPSNHPEFTFIPLSDNLSESKLSPGDFFGIISTLNKNCEVPFQQCVQQLLKADDPRNRISCIIYDGFMVFSQSVADRFKLPGISVRTSAAANILAFAVFPRLHNQGYISLLDLMSQDQEPDLESLRLKELTAFMRTNTTDGMLEFRTTLTDSLKNSSAIIVNTVELLEQEAKIRIEEMFPSSFFAIGPFHKLAPTISSSLLKEDDNCISWLNRQVAKSVIYVSFGSMASMDEKELLEMAWGLAESEQPFLWVIRPGIVGGSKGIELLPKSFKQRVGERGYIVEWAPQKEVLEHEAIGGFWTHCGWNSILESISEGVPMLCRPFFGDQSLNMKHVCDVWNVGLELEREMERGKIERAIRKLMVETEGDEMRKRAKNLKQNVDESLKEGGSSCNSLNELAEKILSF